MTYPTKVETLALQIMDKMPNVGRWQRKFLRHLFVLWLSLRGRYNFTHLARYGGGTKESTYRNNFARPFDWLAFNTELCRQHLSSELILAFDPSYLSKSGRHTEGVDYYWSGTAQQVKWGLEASGIAAVDLHDRTALHLLAVQTVLVEEDESLLDYYASILVLRQQRLRQLSTYVVADAYFSRQPFVRKLRAVDLHLTSRLRQDCVLRYLYTGPQSSGRGRRRTYDGKVDVRHLREDIFTPCARAENGCWVAYTAVVNVRSWQCSARVVVVHDLDASRKVITSHRSYVCTDESLDGGEVLHQYISRYQQEFLYRDAKQELGLEDCQAYSWEKIDFHLNCSLTVGSLAKAAHHLEPPTTEPRTTEPRTTEQRTAFSIADIKTQYVNEYQARRILSMCRLDLHDALIVKLWPAIRDFGLRRA
jgi:hypothetical protein